MRYGALRTSAILGVALLAACGTQPDDRTTGGAAAGAGTGATIGLIGGGAGALTGATTKPEVVDLGPPPWSRSN